MAYKVYVYGSRKAFPAEGLAVGTVLPFDVFVNEGNFFTKVYGSGQFFGPGERSDLLQRGVNEVYVDARDTRELERYLQRTSPERPADPEDPATVREYVGHKASYFQVDRNFLLPGASIAFGIYRIFDLRLIPVVEVADGSQGIIPAGLSTARGEIVIRNEDIPQYQRYIDARLSGDAGLAVPPGDKEKIRAVAIKERSRAVVKDLLEDPRSGENIRKGKKVVSEMTECILSNRDVLHDLISLSSYDMYTYTHSVNVAVLSAGIGIAHGLDREALESLGVGALLHDIGKSSVPPEVLNKPGKLTDQEFDIVKTHVVEGEKILQENRTVSMDSHTVVLQHHERLSGGGYPNRLSGASVTTFGRICAIADCYDAMTTNRPYNRASTPYQALLLLKGQSQHYDSDLLATFIRVLGRVQEPEPAIAGAISPPAG
jgi:HD-GYP domain-containing protein (c-di-GMP phosphodiesterase class II)